jgi:hypothetical protein
MLFFQLALLIGYTYVHAVTVPLTIRNQAILLILLVTAAVLFLPITPSKSMKPLAPSQQE